MTREAFGMPIRTLSDGEQITENGLYDISMADYHGRADLCDGPSISNSRLRMIERCPEKYRAQVDDDDSDDTQAQTFGRMAHTLCIEGRFPSDVVINPYDDFRTKEAQAWKAEQVAKGLSVFKRAEIDDVYGMAERLSREPMVRDGLFGGPLEVSVIARDPQTGIWIKARPDSLPTDTIWGDYKTVRSADPDYISRAILDYGYHCQAALSAEAIALACRRAMESFVLVCQEKKKPYTVTIAAISDAAIEWGARQNRLALNRLEHCLKTNDWPGYADGPVTVGLPAFEMKRLKDHDALFPTVPSLKELANA
jgi:PDDEXK-like domain of unknown function (DUF3799)